MDERTMIGYARVSTQEQASDGVGLEAQRAAIGGECERRGWGLARVEEDSLSGKTLNRPGLQRALGACRDGEVDGIVRYSAYRGEARCLWVTPERAQAMRLSCNPST